MLTILCDNAIVTISHDFECTIFRPLLGIPSSQTVQERYSSWRLLERERGVRCEVIYAIMDYALSEPNTRLGECMLNAIQSNTKMF